MKNIIILLGISFYILQPTFALASDLPSNAIVSCDIGHDGNGLSTFTIIEDVSESTETLYFHAYLDIDSDEDSKEFGSYTSDGIDLKEKKVSATDGKYKIDIVGKKGTIQDRDGKMTVQNCNWLHNVQ